MGTRQDDNDDDYDDDGYPMVGDLLSEGSGYRKTSALKLIPIYIAEIQN